MRHLIICKNRKIWFGMGSALLFMAISVSSVDNLPLYDGVGFPDEAYRYIKPPNALSRTTAAPQPVVADVPLRQGRNIFGVGMQSSENGPQAVLFIERQTLQAPDSLTKMSVGLTPIALDNAHTVSGGYLAGNVYRISAKVAGKAVYASDQHSFIDLRLPQNYVNTAQMYFRVDLSQVWQKLPTVKTGNDVYEAHFNGFGDYALSSTKKAESTTVKRTSAWMIITTVILFVSAIVGIVAIVRWRVITKQKSNSKAR